MAPSGEQAPRGDAPTMADDGLATVVAFFVFGAACVVDDSRTPQAVATEATQSMVGQSALRRMALL